MIGDGQMRPARPARRLGDERSYPLDAGLGEGGPLAFHHRSNSSISTLLWQPLPFSHSVGGGETVTWLGRGWANWR